MKRFLPALFLASFLGVRAVPADAPSETPLDAVVDRVVAAHPELKFYAAEVAAAQHARRAAGARPEPELSLELGRRRVTDPAGILAGEGATWSASVTQTFEWPGRVALRQAIANRDLELAELGLARFRSALDARVRTLAFALHASVLRAAAIAEVAQRFAELKETLLAREPAGVTPLLETRVIEAAELALRRRATEAALAADRARVEFNQLRGAPVDAPIAVAPPRLVFQTPPDTAALLAAARENNFAYSTRRLELAQRTDNVRLAHHERRPDFALAPFYSQARAGEREVNYGVGLTVSLPFGARRDAAVDTARARQQQAEVALLLAERELERDVLAAAREFAAKVAEMEQGGASTPEEFRAAAALADRHYRLGAVPIATYVELQNSYLEASEALLETQREAIAAGLRLQELTGLDFNAVRTAP